MPQSNFNQSEFMLFIYLCMANVDNEISMDEIEVLFDKMDLEHFNSSSVQNELLIGTVYKKYKAVLPENRLETIRTHASAHLSDKQDGLTLLQNLHHIIKADGEIKASEKKLFSEIEQIVNEIG